MKKKYFLASIFLICFILSFTSCSINAEDNDDELVLSTAELNAREIKDVINEKNPHIINAYFYDTNYISNWGLVVGSSNYKFKGTFLRIDNYHFNLDNLHHYRYNGSDLDIYFTVSK